MAKIIKELLEHKTSRASEKLRPLALQSSEFQVWS
jgi:hypothetical protein